MSKEKQRRLDEINRPMNEELFNKLDKIYQDVAKVNAEREPLEQAIELLRAEYERAKKLAYVKKPLAWALFHVWKKVDAMKGGAE